MAGLDGLDLAALVWFLALVLFYELGSTRFHFYGESIAAAVQKHRDVWMIRMSERDSRIVDGQLIGWLVNANAFFASTSALAIGGLSALFGYGDKARTILQSLPFAASNAGNLWEVKVVFLMAIMIYAFFKFAWAFRLSHYTVIMIGATPEPSSSDFDARLDHARRTASLLGLVGAHSNQGLRAFYYTIAGLSWFFHPLAFMAASTLVVVILLRRDYFSSSRHIIRGEPYKVFGHEPGPVPRELSRELWK